MEYLGAQGSDVAGLVLCILVYTWRYGCQDVQLPCKLHHWLMTYVTLIDHWLIDDCFLH